MKFVEFASIPEIGAEAAGMMRFLDEHGTRRVFVNTMSGPMNSISYDGKTVTEYVR